MSINWKVRVNNKVFWLALIPAVLLAAKAIAAVAGIDIDVTVISQKLINVVDAVFGVLAILGVVVDPTTKGVGDSNRAMSYDKPAE